MFTRIRSKTIRSTEDESAKVWHVCWHENKNMWEVRPDGSNKTIKFFKTKAEAESFARELKAGNEGSKVIIHKKTGEIE